MVHWENLSMMFPLTIVVILVLISDSNAKQKTLIPIYWNATNFE